jgi:hypothetical protein
MYAIELFPRDFPEMNIYQQIDSMIDIFGMVMKITGDMSYQLNIESLEEAKKECYRRNSSVNIFDLMGDDFTKDNFKQIKSQSILTR